MPKSCDTMLNLKCNIQWNPMWHLFNYSVNQFKKAMYKIINNSKITADYWKKKKDYQHLYWISEIMDDHCLSPVSLDLEFFLYEKWYYFHCDKIFTF